MSKDINQKEMVFSHLSGQTVVHIPQFLSFYKLIYMYTVPCPPKGICAFFS